MLEERRKKNPYYVLISNTNRCQFYIHKRPHMHVTTQRTQYIKAIMVKGSIYDW